MLMGAVFAITIVGIPFAVACFRIAGFAAFPFGKELIDAELIGEKRIPGTGLLNFLWIILAGLWLAISHALAGIGCCLTIIGIPFGLAHFKLAGVSFAPLGKRSVPKEVAAAAKARWASGRVDEALSGKEATNG